MNYNLNEIQSDPAVLLNKLKTAEVDMKGSKGTVLMVSTQKPKSAKGKKGDQKKKPLKAKGTAKKKKSEPKGTCFFCNTDEHWKRNCKLYLASLKKDGGKQNASASGSGMFMIEILSTNVDKSLWVLDTGSASHICNDMQGLQDSRRLARGEVIIRVGNGARVAAVAVGRYRLDKSNGHSIDLNT